MSKFRIIMIVVGLAMIVIGYFGDTIGIPELVGWEPNPFRGWKQILFVALGGGIVGYTLGRGSSAQRKAKKADKD